MDMRACSNYEAGFDVCDPLASILEWADREPARVLRRRCRSEGVDRSPYEDYPLLRLPEGHNPSRRVLYNRSEFTLYSTDAYRTNPDSRAENHGDYITMPPERCLYGSPQGRSNLQNRVLSPNRARPMQVPTIKQEKHMPKLEELLEKHDEEMLEVKQPLKSILNNPLPKSPPHGILKKPKSKVHSDSKEHQEGRRRQRASSESDNIFSGFHISTAYEGWLGSNTKRIKDNAGTGYSYGTAFPLSNPVSRPVNNSLKTVRYKNDTPKEITHLPTRYHEEPVMHVLRTTAINSDSVDKRRRESPPAALRSHPKPVENRGRLSPKLAENKGRSSPKPSELRGRSSPTPTESRGRSSPTPTESRGRSSPIPTESRGRSSPTPTESRGRSSPTPTESRGRSSPTPTESRGRSSPTPTESKGRSSPKSSVRSHPKPVDSSGEPSIAVSHTKKSPKTHKKKTKVKSPKTSKNVIKPSSAPNKINKSAGIVLVHPVANNPQHQNKLETEVILGPPSPQTALVESSDLTSVMASKLGSESPSNVDMSVISASASAAQPPSPASPVPLDMSAVHSASMIVPPPSTPLVILPTSTEARSPTVDVASRDVKPAEEEVNLEKTVTKLSNKLNSTAVSNLKNPAFKDKVAKLLKMSSFHHMQTTLVTINPFKPVTDRKESPMNLPDNVLSCLRLSLFPRVPPYIKFVGHDELTAVKVHPAIQKHLKWKLTSITPIVVKKTLMNSGFRLVRSDCDTSEYPQEETVEWIGIWGKHMKSLMFKAIKDGQKMNHFPGTFQIGRKDRLWRNLQKLVNKFGLKEFGIMPKSYVLPHDMKMLKRDWEKYAEDRERWIIKPPASARGTGIKVVSRWTQIPKKKAVVVQKYVSKPLLINGNKFDMRLYVLVTSVHPLRIYMYKDGLARFASVKYNDEIESLGDRYMHLTNYSINKLSKNYTPNEDFAACEGHKWTLQTLFTYLETEKKVNTKYLWEVLKDLVIKTIIAGEASISSLTKANITSRYNCYELFGVDVLLDEELKPWLLEVNISPSLHSASPLDLHVKGPLVTTTLNIAQFQIPVKTNLDMIAKEKPHKLSGLPYDSRLYTVYLSKEERDKHIIYTNIQDREIYLRDILSTLTPDDVRHLIQAEDELTQAVDMERVFPTNKTHKYLAYLTGPRYYNRLFDAWETRYYQNRLPGIDMLRDLCDIGYHLEVPPVPLKNDVDAPSPPVTERVSSSSDVSLEPSPSTSSMHVARVCGENIPQLHVPSPLQPRA